jgi:predicted nucleic acid-binding Zn ribbon protein
MKKCKYCNKEFESKRGMKYCCLLCRDMYYKEKKKRKGGEIECLFCGKIFPIQGSKKYCCKKCQQNARKNRDSFLFKSNCDNCGKEIPFSRSRKRSKNIFCSKTCQAEFRYRKENLPKFNCIICGTEFYQKNSKHVVCSKKCSDILQKQKKKLIFYEYDCDNCGKHFFVNDKKQGKNIFCCLECSSEFVSSTSKQIRNCVICGKSFECLKHEKKKTCSLECMGKYRSIFFIGENSPTYKNVPEEDRIAVCQTCGNPIIFKYNSNKNKPKYCSRRCANIGMITTMTKPHIKVCDMLQEIGISFDIEYPIDKFLIDIAISEKLLIEVMGTYWHCDIRHYDKPKNDKQIKNIEKDKRKKDKIFELNGSNVLYLWEEDVNNNPIICKYLLEKYYINNGILDNYHSMNYSIYNNNLILNDNIVIPYFEIN